MRKATTITIVLLMLALIVATSVQFFSALNSDEPPAPVRRPATSVTTSPGG